MLYDLREEYLTESMDQEALEKVPYRQFHNWFQDILKLGVNDPNAMTLATSTLDGKPSARVVLLKGYDEEGFTFFTNYNSRKGQEITANPQVSLVFYWKELHRQVRVEGIAEKLPEKDSAYYFQSRPKGSQIGAWASPQSQVIKDRTVLKQYVDKFENKYQEADKLPLPPFWGGFLVRPVAIEFWQGQPSRLHDRFRYEKIDGEWKISRLAP